eukprot:7198191-Prymnesium_polylepis.2
MDFLCASARIAVGRNGTQSPQSGLTKALSSEEQTVSTPVVGNASAQSEAGGLKSQQHVSCKPFVFEVRSAPSTYFRATHAMALPGTWEAVQSVRIISDVLTSLVYISSFLPPRLDAFIAFLTRNSRLLQLQRQQLRQDNKTLRVAMNRCGYLPSQVHAGCLPATDTKEEAGNLL